MKSEIGYRPLYQQVHEKIIGDIATGKWLPGEMIPSEKMLAKNLDVSQGTVRKVLNTLTDEGVLERHQGKGTFVARNTSERSLFRFFRLARPGGRRLIPELGEDTVRVRNARLDEIAKLDLGRKDKVIEITRIRLIEGRPVIREIIILPEAIFRGIEKQAPLPNTLYSFYQSSYGEHIFSTEEEISAVLADDEDFQLIGVTQGSPILRIDRVAMSLTERPLEWRVSRCNADNLVYAVSLGL